MTTHPQPELLATGACDCHMHVFDPAWPLAATPTAAAPPSSTLQDYRAVRAALGPALAVVLQSTAYGLDNRCMLAALESLGEPRGVSRRSHRRWMTPACGSYTRQACAACAS